jgi:hypothetical protein
MKRKMPMGAGAPMRRPMPPAMPMGGDGMPPPAAPSAPPMGMKKGGTASSRADGCAQRGKTKGKKL